MAYYAIEPFGEAVEDMRLAKLLAMVHNRTSWGKERGAVPADFLPGGRPRRQLTAEEFKAAMLAGNPGG